MNWDIFLAVFLLAFSGLYWLGADSIRESGIDSGVGAQALPKALAYALAGLSAILIGQSVLSRVVFRTKAPSQPTDAVEDLKPLRAFGVILIGAVYLAIVSFTGYILGLVFLMTATAVYMGKKFSLPLAAIMTGGAVVYWLLFVKLLHVPLPAGIFGQLPTLF